MRFDHSAGLRPWPVEFDLDGQTWRIPALPAADWLDAFIDSPVDLAGIVPGLVADPDEGDTLAGRLFDAAYDDEDDLFSTGLEEARVEVARTVLAAAAGVPWWIAGRLAVEAVTWTGVGGELVLRGVDYERAPLAAVLAAAYRVIVSSTDQKQLPKILTKIEAPPPGMAKEAFDEGAAAAAFMNVMNQTGG